MATGGSIWKKSLRILSILREMGEEIAPFDVIMCITAKKIRYQSEKKAAGFLVSTTFT